MKVVPKKYDIRDVRLAKKIVNHMADVLEDKFDFIVESSPEVAFDMSNSGMVLTSIKFESLDMDAAIIIDEESVMLELGGAIPFMLYQNEGFEDLLRIDEYSLYELDAVTNERLADIRKTYETLY